MTELYYAPTPNGHQQLRDAAIAHPTMAQGLGPLLANVQPRQSKSE